MDENKEVNSTDPKREKVRVIPLSAIDDAADHPFGVRDDEEMAELTESLAVFMPFRVQEVCHNDGIYFANNAISKNLIMVNRAELLNGNGFITGVSGSGKSILAKQEIINLFLADKNADNELDPNDNTKYIIRGSLVDIAAENSDVLISARAYVKIGDHYFYADGVSTTCVKDIANIAYNDETANYSEEVKSWLVNYGATKKEDVE